TVPAGKAFILNVSRVGYKPGALSILPLAAGTEFKVDFELALLNSGLEVIIRESVVGNGGMIRENLDHLKLIPSTTGNFESILPHIALGTSSGTGGELSSQYQVRGGNYDENLVYVNDFEVYRPQLVRSGQQEGLSFPNPDLIRDLSFSSGGFDAKYGDKQSSVLDIRYKRPDSLKGSVAISLLGASTHIEGSKPIRSSTYRKFTYLIGARYKSNRYLLNSLQLQGEYVPDFSDIQAYLSYDVNKNWQLGLLGNYNTSLFRFIPESRSTATGLIDFALRLNADFNGQEVDNFKTGMIGISATYLPERKRNPLFIKFIGSAYQSVEKETFDILSDYRLSLVETGLGSENKGKEIALVGDGMQQLYGRNTLFLRVRNLEMKGGYEIHPANELDKTHFFQWGLKVQTEKILDRLNDWEKLDSALYNLLHTEQTISFKNVIKTKNELNSYRFNGYVQDEYTIKHPGLGETKITGGLRMSYWSLNNEFTITPRAQVIFRPSEIQKDITFRLAAGLYYQPPFYREMRNPQGMVNQDLQSQKSAHLVGGLTWDFKGGKEVKIPYRFVTEMYYKKLWDQVVYDIDNVRIQYSGQNEATGYITGVDMRLNGEFVPGAESWFNVSFLRARESIDGVQHQRREKGQAIGHNVVDVPRPTDHFLTVSTFFQDYLPNNENLKVSLNLTFGTGQPFGIPGNNRVFRNTYRYPPYHRVDLGFSYSIWDKSWLSRRPHHLLKFAESSWLSVEIFNLLQVQNVASNTWFKSIYNVQYAIPNYLTSRRVNLKYRINFH
ncbi:MAG: TonB-dependent receptor, partial [Saprospiraceae bacterium]